MPLRLKILIKLRSIYNKIRYFRSDPSYGKPIEVWFEMDGKSHRISGDSKKFQK